MKHSNHTPSPGRVLMKIVDNRINLMSISIFDIFIFTVKLSFNDHGKERSCGRN